ncbi:carbohydrate ABC transporter substrate-binding protein, CUT1 family [Halobacillus karajensis]|uniref:extracellular solute-binding protein n=1 Tax=Halobacillus karajensis TaxID=195088 RepID=UPI0008A775D7|nr:extracellular solute-binding protein [Halobacillus karajensis]SEH41516.1 carbohydrate ABC transporter substrate-binding protein, CUT1 family [Halobacillus karajensis]
MWKPKVWVTALIILFITAGCSDSESSTDGGSGDDTSKTLTLWHIETGESEVAIEDAVKRFEENHEGVNVEVVRQENDPYKTKLSVAMGGGTPPDVFHSWGGGWLEKFVEAGQVKDLSDDIDPEQFLPAALSPAEFEGKNYGAPLAMDIVPVWYNKGMFEKFGLEEPETYEELIEIIETLKSNDIVPFSLANQSKWPGSFYYMYFAERFGGPDLFNEAYKREGRGFDDEAYVKAGEKIRELAEMGAFPDGFNGMNFDTGQSRQLLYAEQAGMIIQGNWMLGTTRNDMPEFEEKLGFFLFPAMEGGQGSKKDIVGGVSPVYSVAEKSENKELATELVKELTSKATAQQLANTDGAISAVKDIEYDDEYVQEISNVLEEAEYMQTFYDQTLPPELAEVHLDTTQALFGLSKTPEEAAKEVEEKAKEVLE